MDFYHMKGPCFRIKINQVDDIGAITETAAHGKIKVQEILVHYIVFYK